MICKIKKFFCKLRKVIVGGDARSPISDANEAWESACRLGEIYGWSEQQKDNYICWYLGFEPMWNGVSWEEPCI